MSQIQVFALHEEASRTADHVILSARRESDAKRRNDTEVLGDAFDAYLAAEARFGDAILEFGQAVYGEKVDPRGIFLAIRLMALASAKA